MMSADRSAPIRQAPCRCMLWRMNPSLRTYFDFVVPLFWPWLVWNLLRLARWHARSGREALCRVDQYGNIRIVLISDPPPPTISIFMKRRVSRPGRILPAAAMCRLSCALSPQRSAIVRTSPVWSRLVMIWPGLIRHCTSLVRPRREPRPNSAYLPDGAGAIPAERAGRPVASCHESPFFPAIMAARTRPHAEYRVCCIPTALPCS